MLVDTSFPLSTDAICQAIADAGQDPGKLTKIILTHQDIDHMGCVKDLLDRYPAIQVLCHEAEAPYISGVTRHQLEQIGLVMITSIFPYSASSIRRMKPGRFLIPVPGTPASEGISYGQIPNTHKWVVE